MRAARNEHVIEPVRLTELLSQSLEIVPDACRQRLTVDTDETLRRLGVVRVARTVLRLILQNLIINAADAVRDAGREKGVLRVSAEIVRERDVQQLHLQCKRRRRRHRRRRISSACSKKVFPPSLRKPTMASACTGAPTP